MRDRIRHGCVVLLGIAGFVAFGMFLENEWGVPFDLTYRIACAGGCLAMMVWLGDDQRKARWFRVSVLIAAIFSFSLFFTPVVHHPASRGEAMIFALPDTAIFLFVRAIGYPAGNEHQRAVRQQLFVGSMLAFVAAALLLAVGFIPDRGRSSDQRHSAGGEIQTPR